MKNLILFFLFGFTILMSAQSCSDSEFISNEESTSQCETINSSVSDLSLSTQDLSVLDLIQAYNDSMMNGGPQPRFGFSVPFWVYVDAAGAVAAYEITWYAGIFSIGTVGTAAAVASICEVLNDGMEIAERPSIEQILLCVEYSNDISIPSLPTIMVPSYIRNTATNIGIKHNKILAAFHSVDFLGVSTANVSNPQSEEEIQLLEDFLEMENVSDLYSLIPNPSSYTQAIMTRFNQLCIARTQSNSSINQIISDYSAIIENSTDLTSNEKKALYIGMTVYAYSFNYWTNHSLSL